MLRKIIFFLLFFTASSAIFAAEKITVLLDWFLNPDHAPLFVAKEKGFFKEQNLEVELIGPADPSDPPKLVAAENADIAITYEPQFMEQVDQGLPLIRIGSLIDKPLNCIAVLKDGPIQKIADLKNKRVGYSTGDINSVTLSTMLKKNGLTLKDVESINVHYDLSQALLSKKVDAVTGIMRTFEVIQMEINKHPVRTFFPEENGMPTYEELIYVVNKKHMNDPRWKKFLIAVKKGSDYLQKHPEEMWQAFVKAHPEINDKLNRLAWTATLPYFSKNPASINEKEWEIFANFMQTNGLIKKAKPIDVYTINTQPTRTFP
jgi:putative hydroxymethylpyrimidine transport system substrate-binding protein